MNTEMLLKHFDRLSEAPDAVAGLRRFILDLAVRGKLIEQDVNDEPAAELLKRIQAEKTRLVASGKVKKDRLLPLIEDDQLLFKLPLGWAWVRNGNLFNLRKGRIPKNLSESKTGLPYLDIEALDRGVVRRYSDDTQCPQSTDCDILVVCDGSRSGLILNGKVGIVGSTLSIIDTPIFTQPFVRLIFRQGYERLNSTMKGAAIPHLDTNKLSLEIVGLPPLAEQNRIVTKVDELMLLCDELQAAQNTREKRRDQLLVASLHQIQNPDDLAQIFLDHLPRLTRRKEHIQKLRQSILNLAVRGRLVPQDTNDESVTELLKRIETEKAELVNGGFIPRSKASANVPGFTFELPINWRAIRFDDVCNFVTSGSRGWAEYYANSGPKFVRAQNIRFGRLRLDDLACVNPPATSEGKRTQVSEGDILIVITGAGVTNPALMNLDLGEAYVSQHVALIRPTTTTLSRWLLLCLMSGSGGRDELLERAYGAGKPGLNLDNIRSLKAPLPPLAEQKHIIAKVDELMSLCDQLEANLTATQADSRRFLEAVLHEALAPSPAVEMSDV